MGYFLLGCRPRDDAQAPCIWARLYFCSESHPPSDHPLRTQLGDFTCVKADIRKELIGILPKFRCGIGRCRIAGTGNRWRNKAEWTPTLVNEFLDFAILGDERVFQRLLNIEDWRGRDLAGE